MINFCEEFSPGPYPSSLDALTTTAVVDDPRVAECFRAIKIRQNGSKIFYSYNFS